MGGILSYLQDILEGDSVLVNKKECVCVGGGGGGGGEYTSQLCVLLLSRSVVTLKLHGPMSEGKSALESTFLKCIQ